MLTWLDVLALVAAASATAVGMRKGAVFLLVFPAALAIYYLAAPLVPPPVRPALALVGSLVAAQLLGRFYFLLSNFWDALLGGIGGLLWGALLAVGIWTSLPADYSVATGAWRYPAPHLPLAVQEAVTKSPFALPLFELTRNHPILRRLFLPNP